MCGTRKASGAHFLIFPTLDDTKLLLTQLAKWAKHSSGYLDGTEGAYADDGSRFLRIPMYPDTRGPFERTWQRGTRLPERVHIGPHLGRRLTKPFSGDQLTECPSCRKSVTKGFAYSPSANKCYLKKLQRTIVLPSTRDFLLDSRACESLLQCAHLKVHSDSSILRVYLTDQSCSQCPYE